MAYNVKIERLRDLQKSILKERNNLEMHRNDIRIRINSELNDVSRRYSESYVRSAVRAAREELSELESSIGEVMQAMDERCQSLNTAIRTYEDTEYSLASSQRLNMWSMFRLSRARIAQNPFRGVAGYVPFVKGFTFGKSMDTATGGGGSQPQMMIDEGHSKTLSTSGQDRDFNYADYYAGLYGDTHGQLQLKRFDEQVNDVLGDLITLRNQNFDYNWSAVETIMAKDPSNITEAELEAMLQMLQTMSVSDGTGNVTLDTDAFEQFVEACFTDTGVMTSYTTEVLSDGSIDYINSYNRVFEISPVFDEFKAYCDEHMDDWAKEGAENLLIDDTPPEVDFREKRYRRDLLISDLTDQIASIEEPWTVHMDEGYVNKMRAREWAAAEDIPITAFDINHTKMHNINLDIKIDETHHENPYLFSSYGLEVSLNTHINDESRPELLESYKGEAIRQPSRTFTMATLTEGNGDYNWQAYDALMLKNLGDTRNFELEAVKEIILKEMDEAIEINRKGEVSYSFETLEDVLENSYVRQLDGGEVEGLSSRSIDDMYTAHYKQYALSPVFIKSMEEVDTFVDDYSAKNWEVLYDDKTFDDASNNFYEMRMSYGLVSAVTNYMTVIDHEYLDPGNYSVESLKKLRKTDLEIDINDINLTTMTERERNELGFGWFGTSETESGHAALEYTLLNVTANESLDLPSITTSYNNMEVDDMTVYPFDVDGHDKLQQLHTDLYIPTVKDGRDVLADFVIGQGKKQVRSNGIKFAQTLVGNSLAPGVPYAYAAGKAYYDGFTGNEATIAEAGLKEFGSFMKNLHLGGNVVQLGDKYVFENLSIDHTYIRNNIKVHVLNELNPEMNLTGPYFLDEDNDYLIGINGEEVSLYQTVEDDTEKYTQMIVEFISNGGYVEDPEIGGVLRDFSKTCRSYNSNDNMGRCNDELPSLSEVQK